MALCFFAQCLCVGRPVLAGIGRLVWPVSQGFMARPGQGGDFAQSPLHLTLGGASEKHLTFVFRERFIASFATVSSVCLLAKQFAGQLARSTFLIFQILQLRANFCPFLKAERQRLLTRSQINVLSTQISHSINLFTRKCFRGNVYNAHNTTTNILFVCNNKSCLLRPLNPPTPFPPAPPTSLGHCKLRLPVPQPCISFNIIDVQI